MAKLAVTQRSTQARITDATFGAQNTLLGKNDRGGVEKVKRFTFTNDTAGTISAGSYIKLHSTGPGLITGLTLFTSAMGAARVLNVGTQEYYNPYTNAVVASNITALVNGLDVSAVQTGFSAQTVAGSGIATGTGVDLPSNTDILAQVTGGTIPQGATINGFLRMIEY